MSRPETLTLPEVESICTQKKSAREYGGPCPFCKEGWRLAWWPEEDRFHCFNCQAYGFIVDQNGHSPHFDPQWRQAWLDKQVEQQRQYRIERQEWAARLNEEETHITYQNNLNGHSRLLQDHYGLTPETIEGRYLGYADTCPTFWGSDSLTIPWFSGGKVIEIRHRLLKPGDSGKYRTERSGPFNAIYNVDRLKTPGIERILLLEGEFKTMTVEQAGLWAVGIAGISCFQAEWARLFAHLKQVLVIFDPGKAAIEWSVRTARMIAQAGVEVLCIEVPDKIDDLFVKHGWTADTLQLFANTGRRIHA